MRKMAFFVKYIQPSDPLSMFPEIVLESTAGSQVYELSGKQTYCI